MQLRRQGQDQTCNNKILLLWIFKINIRALYNLLNPNLQLNLNKFSYIGGRNNLQIKKNFKNKKKFQKNVCFFTLLCEMIFNI